MRKMIPLLALLALVTLPAAGKALSSDNGPVADSPTSSSKAPASPATVAPGGEGQGAPSSVIAPEASSPVEVTPAAVQLSYPSCYTVHGTSCSVVGSKKICQWSQFEPDVCVCQEDLLWQCIWTL